MKPVTLGIVCLFTFLILNFLMVPHQEDVTDYYIPAAQMLLRGESPYAINDGARVFLYPPPALIAFLPLAFIGPAYEVVLLLSAWALIYLVRAQRADAAWLLYPPALMVLSIGQTDLIVLALGLFAFKNRDRPWSDVLMAALCLFKPHVGLFWMIPFAALKTPQITALARYGGVILFGLCLSALLVPEWWGQWWAALGQNAVYYQFRTHSLAAGGMTILSVVLMPLLLVVARHEKVARVLYAATTPFSSYYAGAGLIGAVPGGFVALSWLLAGLTLATRIQVSWLEPVAMLIWLAWPLAVRIYMRRSVVTQV